MKPIIFIVFLVLALSCAKAQVAVSDLSVSIPTIIINARLIGEDSVVVPFNDHYLAVADPCTKIIRYGHYNFNDKHFYGKFKDVNKADSTQIVAEGNFSKEGLKNGAFTVNYLNGKLQAKGNFNNDIYNGDWVFYYSNGNLQAKGKFKKGKYDGKWETYYNDGKPKMVFENIDDDFKIINAWSPDGKQLIINGTGYYESVFFDTKWDGKLVNGMPDSAWVYNNRQPNSNLSVVEYFKNNEFVRGQSKIDQYTRNYNDGSHISLLPRLPSLEINHSESLDISFVDCNGNETDSKIIMFGKAYFTHVTHINGVSVIK